MDIVVVVRGPEAEALPFLGVPGARVQTGGAIAVEREGVGGIRLRRHLVELPDPASIVAWLGDNRADVLVLDARGGGLAHCVEVLERLFPDGALSGPVLPDRVLGIVSPGAEGVEAAFRFGRFGIGMVAADPDVHDVLERIDAILSARGRGRIALCLAGGGIEGLLYELGVLRALESCLDRSIVDLDVFCGISAGAILGALLANGIGPDEIRRGLEQGTARLDPITRRDLFDLDAREIARRLAGLTGEVLRGGQGPRGVVSSLGRAVPLSFFAGRRLERWLERQLTRPGMANRWDALRRPLFVGATDQDTSEAMVFSAEATPEVPIHRAVRASAAMLPFYAPIEIDGRWYIDGAFSRTTNMRVAVEQGATLVLLVDPLVPVRSEVPGYVRERGGIFAGMQSVKSLINGRFDKAVHAIRAMFPDVAFHLFKPEGDEMRILSGSPMKVFYRREVEEIAYRTTLAKVGRRAGELERDFALHGVRFQRPETPEPREAPPALDPAALGIGDLEPAGA